MLRSSFCDGERRARGGARESHQAARRSRRARPVALAAGALSTPLPSRHGARKSSDPARKRGRCRSGKLPLPTGETGCTREPERRTRPPRARERERHAHAVAAHRQLTNLRGLENQRDEFDEKQRENSPPTSEVKATRPCEPRSSRGGGGAAVGGRARSDQVWGLVAKPATPRQRPTSFSRLVASTVLLLGEVTVTRTLCGESGAQRRGEGRAREVGMRKRVA